MLLLSILRLSGSVSKNSAANNMHKNIKAFLCVMFLFSRAHETETHAEKNIYKYLSFIA